MDKGKQKQKEEEKEDKKKTKSKKHGDVYQTVEYRKHKNSQHCQGGRCRKLVNCP